MINEDIIYLAFVGHDFAVICDTYMFWCTVDGYWALVLSIWSGIYVVFERGSNYCCMGCIDIVEYLGWEVIPYVHSGHDMIVAAYIHSGHDMTLEFQIWIY